MQFKGLRTYEHSRVWIYWLDQGADMLGRSAADPECAPIYRGYIGIMENKMETTI